MSPVDDRDNRNHPVCVQRLTLRNDEELRFKRARQASDGETLVAVGGDGTINEVLDGIMQSGHPDIRLGILYAGTSPDFCRFHGIPTNPAQALDNLLQGRIEKVDVVRIEFARAGGARAVSHFGCGCNIGLGAAVARFANRQRKYLGDRLGTGLAVLRAILREKPVDLEIFVDGTPHRLAAVNNLSILKSPFIASGLKLDVTLAPDDGRLVLAGIQGQSRAGLCRVLPGFYSGNAASEKTVFIQECKAVGIRSKEPREIEFDGDPRGWLPVDISILPRALNLVGGGVYATRSPDNKGPVTL